MLIAALLVVSSRNPVHAVLYLIFAFFQAAGLFLFIGAEFAAMIVIIVYVGAVAVLFLFVVMMLNVDKEIVVKRVQGYLPVGLAIGAVLFVELIVMVNSVMPNMPQPLSATAMYATPILTTITNTEALGNVLYTKYTFLLQIAGLLLLVAMIGAIVLTLRDRKEAKRQSIAKQVFERREDVVKVYNIPFGENK